MSSKNNNESRAQAVTADGERNFTIGELAEEFAITTRAIRFYEARGLIAPRRFGTSRIYSRRDRGRLALILRGKNLGFTLEDIAEYLALYDVDPSQRVQTEVLIGKVDAAIADLVRKRADIERSLHDLGDIRAKCAEFLAAVGANGEPAPAGPTTASPTIAAKPRAK